MTDPTRARPMGSIDRAPAAELIDEALTALLLRYRGGEIDDVYEAAYRDHPIDEADEWATLHRFAMQPQRRDRPAQAS